MAHLGKSSIFWYRTYKMNGHIWRCRQSTFKRYIEKIHCTIHSWGSTWTLKRILGSHSFHPDAQWRIDQIDHHPPEIIQIFLLYIEHSSIIMESLVSLILTYSKYYILYIYILYTHVRICIQTHIHLQFLEKPTMAQQSHNGLPKERVPATNVHLASDFWLMKHMGVWKSDVLSGFIKQYQAWLENHL